MLLGIAVGVVGGGIVAAIAALSPHLLTHDPTLWPILGQVVAQVFLSMIFTGIDVCGCAINIAVSVLARWRMMILLAVPASGF